MTPTPTAALAELAADCLRFERMSDFSQQAARAASRDMLTDSARDLGIPETEIEAAVDAALGGK
jgi:hypothetical protein